VQILGISVLASLLRSAFAPLIVQETDFLIAEVSDRRREGSVGDLRPLRIE